MVEIRQYVTRTGRNVFEDWLTTLRDGRAEMRIRTRLDRLATGNFGDCKAVGGGVFELRVDYGPGYRIYYAMVSRTCALLLLGGDKRRQSSDIRQAIDNLKDYKQRSIKR